MKTAVRHSIVDPTLQQGLAAIREEIGIPENFGPAVADAADAIRSRGPLPTIDDASRRDARDLVLRAIDPPGSRDLDQAYGAQRRSGGYRVHYAIADLAAFIEPGSLIDREAHRRGVTQYGPDQRASLHPEPINEDAASLNAGVDRPCLLWTIDLDDSGVLAVHRVERATVRVREAISYATAQERIDTGSADTGLSLLREIGERRLSIETERGAVSLALPSQEITKADDGAYLLHYGTPLPVERWNAQISLLTGMAAASTMLDAGVGVLRTLPEPAPEDIEQLRHSAQAIGVSWPDAMSYPERARTLNPSQPKEAAFLLRAARTLGGAGYAAFTSADEIPVDAAHAAIAAPYAHVTAPLRRLVDRYANEVLLAVYADNTPPGWTLETLAELPRIMKEATGRARAYERAVVDLVETYLVERRQGETFDAMIVGRGRGTVTIQLVDPAIITQVDGDGLSVGTWVKVRLTGVDHVARRLEWRVVR